MKYRICLFLTACAAALSLALAQPADAPVPVDAGQMPTVKTTVDEVVLDFIARDKKGKPITDLKPEELTLTDNGAKQDLSSFRLAGAVIFQPEKDGTDLSILVEVPLHGLQPKTDSAQKTLNVHFSLCALVKDSRGAIAEKLTRDWSFQVSADQLKLGNFVEKMQLVVAPGRYTLETAVMDRESGKIGMDANEPFQFQGQAITPTLNSSVSKAENSFLRLFLVVYRESTIPAKPTMEIELLQNGKSLTKVPLPLPEADAQDRIPYVMTIPAASIPPGLYEVRAMATQGDTTAESQTEVKIETM